MFARHPWHAPFSLPAVVALDPWVSLWSRRPRKAGWPHGPRKSWVPQRSTWSRGAWWPWWALDASLALFTPVWVLSTLTLFSFLSLRSRLSSGTHQAHLPFWSGVAQFAI